MARVISGLIQSCPVSKSAMLRPSLKGTTKSTTLVLPVSSSLSMRAKPSAHANPQGQHLLTHHVPPWGVVKVAGHAGHFLARAYFDGVIEHKGSDAGWI